MNHPIVFDVLIRQEVEAADEVEALKFLGEVIVTGHLRNEKAAFEVIRDDNKFPPKDYVSRQENGFAIFTSKQKHQLLEKLKTALEEAGQGNPAPGEQLLRTLHAEFEYLENSGLLGVDA